MHNTYDQTCAIREDQMETTPALGEDREATSSGPEHFQ
jgi:hypothetical protein